MLAGNKPRCSRETSLGARGKQASVLAGNKPRCSRETSLRAQNLELVARDHKIQIHVIMCTDATSVYVGLHMQIVMACKYLFWQDVGMLAYVVPNLSLRHRFKITKTTYTHIYFTSLADTF